MQPTVMSELKFKTLDIRPSLERGGEPFSAILKTVDALEPTQGLKLIAPFLPSPLIELLKGEGMACRFERDREGSWCVYFWRELSSGVD